MNRKYTGRIIVDETSSEEEKRCVGMAFYILDNGATIRETAAVFGIPKTTVHKKMTETIYDYSSYLGNEVRKVLNRHFKEAPRRGGLALQRKLREMRQSSEK